MKIGIGTIFFLIFCGQLFAQEESFPCKEANPSLKELIKNGNLESLYIHDCSGPGLGMLSSSFLKPSGEAPKIIEDPEGMEIPDDSEFVDWTCRYSAGNLQDDDPSTAWVEGVDGNGIGEVIIVPCLQFTKKVEIWIGYGKSDKLFSYNSRPKQIRALLISAERAGASQYGTVYEELKVSHSEVIDLEDINGFQPLNLGEEFQFISEEPYFLGIEILEVYEGLKWQDNCISEIRNVD